MTHDSNTTLPSSLPASLTLDALRTFEAAARSGSFTEAAKRIHRTQSAVSMQIKKLEDELGAPLFARQGRGVVLTALGEALLPYAARLSALHRETVQTVGAFSQTPLAGTVRLGCPEDYASLHLPRVLASFATDHPDVRVEVWCATSQELLALLEDGALDVTLATHAAPPAEGEVLQYEPVVWIGPLVGAVASRTPLPVAVFHEGCGYRRWALDALEREGRPYRIACTSPSVAAVVSAVRAGLAVAPVARSVAQAVAGGGSDGCRLLGPAQGLPALPAAPIALHTRPAPRSPAVSRLCSCLRSAFQAAPVMEYSV